LKLFFRPALNLTGQIYAFRYTGFDSKTLAQYAIYRVLYAVHKVYIFLLSTLSLTFPFFNRSFHSSSPKLPISIAFADERVAREGIYAYSVKNANFTRSARRAKSLPTSSISWSIGFRVVRTAP
jgi:hypothetical protein